MLTLCGFPVSNYYNKVKLALLEKGVPFTEETVMTKSTDEAVLSASPLAKIPFIRTEHGGVCESQAIMDYIEDAYPLPALMPADAYSKAKVRELITYIDWHLEITARELYGQAFFGGAQVSDSAKATLAPSSGWPSLRLSWRAVPLPRRIVRPMSACRWSVWPPKRCMGKTCCWLVVLTTRRT